MSQFCSPFLTVCALLCFWPFSFDLCFSLHRHTLSCSFFLSFTYSLSTLVLYTILPSIYLSVIILWQISFDHRKSKERCITILAPLPILNDDHLMMFFYITATTINYSTYYYSTDGHYIFDQAHAT